MLAIITAALAFSGIVGAAALLVQMIFVGCVAVLLLHLLSVSTSNPYDISAQN